MNPLPPNADELVSAYLDGEAAPDEVVIVESSAELMARVDSMRAVSGMVGEPVPTSDQKEVHIAAALGAFDELFGQSTTAATTPVPEVPTLRAVPTPATEAPSVTSDSVTAAASDTTVTSFGDAKARRRPKRFNIGVIAAAVAALLLVAALSVLTFGRPSGDDVASSAADGAQMTSSVETSSDASSDAVGDAMADDVAEPMELRTESLQPGLSDAGSAAAEAAPAPTQAPEPPVANSSEVQGAIDEDAMEDAVEEASEEEAMDDEEAMSDDDSAADFDFEPLPFSFGEFATAEDLEQELGSLSSGELDERKAGVGQGIFDSCQDQIRELRASDTATLIGEASVDGMARELHLFTNEDGVTTVYLVDPQDCSVLNIFG